MENTIIEYESGPEVEQLLSNFTITNDDLRKNKYKYSQEELERNVIGLRFLTILHTQKVNGQFIAKYILNDDYYEGIEDDHKFTEEQYFTLATTYHKRRIGLLDKTYT
jgi:hypothetical protein